MAGFWGRFFDKIRNLCYIMPMNEGYEKYLALVGRVDHFLVEVRKRYGDQILCRKGCGDCCHQFLSLWPVEAYHISEGLKALSAALMGPLERQAQAIGWNQCPLLVDEACAVYDYRPILCRTYGYPFLSREEGDPSGTLGKLLSPEFSRAEGGGPIGGRLVSLDLDALNRMLAGANLAVPAGSGEGSYDRNLPHSHLGDPPWLGFWRGEVARRGMKKDRRSEPRRKC